MTEKTSSYRGVSWNKDTQSWKAQITIDNECKYLGLFDKEIDASNAYQDAKKIEGGAIVPKAKMLTQRQLDNIAYFHYDLNEPLDSIIHRYTHGKKKIVKGVEYQALKSNAYSLMKQITFAINKRRVFRINPYTVPVDVMHHKDDAYYDNEMLYGKSDMIEMLRNGRTYSIADIKYEDVVGELPENAEPSSYTDFIIKEVL